MSCYIVTGDTISHTLQAYRVVYELEGRSWSEREQIQLAKSLIMLNISAYAARYGYEGSGIDWKTEDDVITATMLKDNWSTGAWVVHNDVDRLRAWREIHRLHYQCSEGDLPVSSDVFKELDRVVKDYQTYLCKLYNREGYDALSDFAGKVLAGR